MNQRLVLQKPGEQAIGLGVQGENYSNIIKIDGKDVKVRTFYLERKEFATLLIAFHNIHLTTSQLQIFQMVLAPQQATQPKEELEIEKSETRKNYVSLPKAGQLTRFQVENETQSVLSAFKISLKTPVFPKLLEVAWKYHVAYEEHLAYIKEVKKMKRIDAEYIEETNKKIDIKSDGYKKSVKVFDQLSQETLAGLMENDHPELIILKKVVTSLMETTQTLEKKDLPLLESCKTLNKACVNFITTFVQAVGVNALPGTGGNNDRSHVKTG